MRNGDIPVLYTMMGEYAPGWIIAVLLLLGTLGSITSINLLLPPDVSINTMRSWFSETNQQWFNEQQQIQDNSSNIQDITITPLEVRARNVLKDGATSSSNEPGVSNNSRLNSSVTEMNQKALLDEERSVNRQNSQVASSDPLDSTAEQDSSFAEYGLEASSLKPDVRITSDPGSAPVKPVATEKVNHNDQSFANGSSESAIPAVIHTADKIHTVQADDETIQMPAAESRKAAVDIEDSPDKESSTTAQVKRSQVGIDKPAIQACPPLFFVHFKSSGVRPIDPDLSVKVKKLQVWLSTHPNAKLIIEGHTDSHGAEEWNLLISHRRAKMVEKILASVGVPHSQMTVRALGEYAPFEGHSPESAINRRVTLRLSEADPCPTDFNPGDNP